MWQIYSNIEIFSIQIFIRIFIRIKILIRIYLDIRSCQKNSYAYIRIFVRIIFLTRIYSDIRSCQNRCHTLVWVCLLQSEKKTNNASEWCFSSVPFLLCSRPVFSLSYIPTATTLSSVYLSCVSKYATKVNSTDSAWE